MKAKRFLGVLALSVLLVSVSQAKEQTLTEDRMILQDPEWRKHFLGSYGVLSGVEPTVNPVESEMLKQVLDLMNSDPQAAIKKLQQQPDASRSAVFDFILANLEFQNANLDAAAESYAKAIKKFPDFRRAHKNLGLLKVQKGDCATALKHLSRALELGDRDARNFGLLGYCYIQQENYLAAEIAYRNAILQQPDTRDWQLGLARALMAIGHYKDASALLASLIVKYPHETELWVLQANAFIGMEQPKDAAINLEAVRLMGKSRMSSLVLLGDIYMNEGLPDLARSAYTEAIERDSQNSEFRTGYRAVELLVRAQAHDDAQKTLQLVKKKYAGKMTTDDELKLMTLEARIARAQGKSGEAAKLLETVVRRDGTRGDALLELASYYHGENDPARALLLIERAERLKGFEYDALLRHAQIKVEAKDYAKAANLLRQALSIKREPRVETFLSRIEQAMQL